MAVHFSQRAAIALTLFTVAAAALPCRAKDDVVTPNRKIEAFDLPQVRLLPSPFKNAQDKNAAYLLSLDADRLLAIIRSNAGNLSGNQEGQYPISRIRFKRTLGAMVRFS